VLLPFVAADCLLLLLIMSSADAWIASLGEESSAPSPFTSSVAGLQLSTGVSGSSGEYGGGGANLLFVVDENTLKRLWFVFFLVLVNVAFVGRQSRTPVLPVVLSTCGVVKYESKFQPKLGHFYLWSNDTTGFCEPCFPESLVPQEV